MQVYFSHSYRDVAVNSYFLKHFVAEEIPLQADQKTDIWCVAKLERYLSETTGFISIIPQRPSEDDPAGYSPYIGQELNLARRARVPRLLFIDEHVLNRHPVDFPEDAVPFRPGALDADHTRHADAIRAFGQQLETAYRPPLEARPMRATVVAGGGPPLRRAAQDVQELLEREGFRVTLITGGRPGHGLEDINLLETLWRAELCTFLLGERLSDAHLALAMAHAHGIPSIRMQYDARATDCSPSLSGLIRWRTRDVMLVEFMRQLKSYMEGLVFLPALGVRLDPYRGYDPNVNPSLGNEFATVGYRAHSMIHGEFEPTVPEKTYTPKQLNRVFPAAGISVERHPDRTVTLVIPLVVAFGNPDVLEQVGEGPILQSLAERQYKNDEQIDNALRSVLFQVPKPGAADPVSCSAPVISPSCFVGVSDLGALDVQRGRDHGMPSYNDVRRASGLAPARSFTDITHESTDRFPYAPEIDAKDPLNDPDILEFVRLEDDDGNVIEVGSDEAGEDVVVGVRRTTLAARLKAIYGTVDTLDAFVGMLSEPHVPGSELGPLQLAIWKRQFEALRDGDRFFYANDPLLQKIEQAYGITYRHTLAELIKLNVGATVADDVFVAVDESEPEEAVR